VAVFTLPLGLRRARARDVCSRSRRLHVSLGRCERRECPFMLGLRLLVRSLELCCGPTGIERGAVGLTGEYESFLGLILGLVGAGCPILRLDEALSRGLVRRAELHFGRRERLGYVVVDLLVRPHAADQDKDRQDDREQLLALRGLDLLDVNPRAHFPPRFFGFDFVFVRGRSSTSSSQSSAFAIRRSVSMRGGRPPLSSRAMAD
jgi:hypothetical protein